MRIQRLFMLHSSEFGASWKHQMLLGVLLVLMAIAIILVPGILVALIASGILVVGAGLIGSAWEMRHSHNRTQRFALRGMREW